MKDWSLPGKGENVLIDAMTGGGTILTHFGMTMLKTKPWELASRLTDESGIEVIASSDGMTIALDPNECSRLLPPPLPE